MLLKLKNKHATVFGCTMSSMVVVVVVIWGIDIDSCVTC